MKRVVLAYSGGLGSSMAIRWLKDSDVTEIIAFTLDLGQGQELEGIRDRALAAGVSRAHVLDRREEFARDYVLPALKGGAICEDGSPMAEALSRPLIAQTLVDLAEIEEANTIAYGSTCKGKDQAPLDISCRALNPRLEVVAPRFDWLTRDEEIAHARRLGVPMAATVERLYPSDTNLWGRSIDCGGAEDPSSAPPDELYLITRSAESCPDEPAYVELAFDRGAPVAVNGVEMPLVDVIASLGAIAGGHGVGRIDTPCSHPIDITSRKVYEAPAAVVLHAGHRELQRLVTAKDLDRFSRTVGRHYAGLIRSGLWFAPMREALDAFVSTVQDRVTGTVRLRLFKGDVQVAGRSSPHAPVDPALAGGEARDAIDRLAVVQFPERPGSAELSGTKARA